ncbi:MAG: hypothetical protein ACAH83_14425 [Alphaproteobacteria bacterium]
MWFKNSKTKAREDFAKALHAYADSLPASQNGRGTWNFIADEIEKGTADGDAFYAVFKNRLDLTPPPKP